MFGGPGRRGKKGDAGVIAIRLVAQRAVFACIIGTSGGATGADDQPSGFITRAQARDVVLAELQARGYKTQSPKFDLEDASNEDYPDWYHFEALFDTEIRLAHVGMFSVEKTTADMWEQGCKQVRSPVVRRLQASLRAKYRLAAIPERRTSDRDEFCPTE